MRALALGDSYTCGEGVEPAHRWPVQLARALRDGGVDVGEPHVIATTGWSTEELALGIAAAQPLGTYDFVTLGIGVNDQYRGHTTAEYRAQLSPLLDTATALAGGRPDHVLMLSIPDWGVTPFARNEGRDSAQIAREIDAFNDVARSMCEARRIPFVDITPASRERGDADAMVVADGLHPSHAMYARWVDVALPVAHRLLGDTA
ncbi:SGNH/GDSL hydrolase family protein [Lysobacter sp. TY2-98]|uniref:SGNH/GDSL hydrolase family protein n=1 Tax=Lysobacter sp. TY2-98 TaxID=2290922 RepID=UPI000E20B4D5|nr:SGNH/GDSL hydrolase family protein [Lysobacter sp. TY2-98]AXK72846.1 SGNH/GDSL hydrolase family protein [Lysobacter sp. TY2-98]